MPVPRRIRLAAAIVATAPIAILALAGCAPGGRSLEADRKVLDLVAGLPVAEVHRQVAEIDVGTEAGREHLLSGFSWDERDPGRGGATFAWGVGERSRVRVFLVAPRPLRLTFRCWPYAPPGAPPQEVAVEVDGRPAGRVELSAARRDYALDLDPGILRAGTNVLTLRYRHALVPGEQPGAGRASDRRALAVAWDRLRLAPLTSPERGPTAEAGAAGGRLHLPLGATVAYYARLPAGSLLVVDRLESRSGHRSRAGVDGARLRVELREEGKAPREVASLAPGRGRAVVPLPARDRGLVRLALRAVPPRDGDAREGTGELELTAPRVVAPDPGGPADRRPRRAPRCAGTEAASAPAPEPGPGPTAGGRPSFLIFLVDTLRADRLGVYGSTRGLTPAIDAFAERSLVFDRAYAEAPWTRPSVASLLTGLPPRVHGVTTLDDRLAAGATTLPGLLRSAGYRTAAFSTNWQVSHGTGLDQGFDDFVFTPDDTRGDHLVARVLSWLDRRPAGRPFFLYVHALDPHAPYDPPAGFRRRFAPRVADPAAGSVPYLQRIYAASGAERERLLAPIPSLYDGEVAFADQALGTLLEGLAARGLAATTWVVFLADHGEELDEHGALGHGQDLYGEVLHVPLIVRPAGLRRPGRPGRIGRVGRIGRIGDLAMAMDVAPTLLHAAGVPVPGALAGVDLVGPAWDAPESPRPGFADLDYDGRRGVSVVLGPWKLIEPLTAKLGRHPLLFRLDRDPGETEDLAERHPVRAGYLRSLLRRHLLAAAGAGRAAAVGPDPELRRGLEALGYL